MIIIKYKLLSIFLFAVISSIVISTFKGNEKVNILSLGSNLSIGRNPYDKIQVGYDSYVKESLNYDYNYINHIKYEEQVISNLIKIIKYNKEYYIKGKTININQLLALSDVIIIDLNDRNSFKMCNNKKYDKYLNLLKSNLDVLISMIRKVNKEKIVILGVYCKDTKELYNRYIINHMIFDKNVTYINLYEKLNSEYYYLPNKNNIYPSIEGYNYISNLIIKEFPS